MTQEPSLLKKGIMMGALIICCAISLQAIETDSSTKQTLNTLEQAAVVAEGKNVQGEVKDQHGEPLVGVSILVKNGVGGTVTDIDGAFSLMVNEGDELEFSYIGYNNQRVKVTASTGFLTVTLQESDLTLGEVVVTALGIKRSQKALSYNVQELKNTEITNVKDVNFMNSLSGKVAGVTINSSATGIGGATRVVMRGTKSITKDNNALYVIDGVPIYNTNNGNLGQNDEYAGQPSGEGISDLNPDDIESMTVLTGAAAAALYGSNAANGAIIITTKKGTAGKVKVVISNQTSFESPFVTPQFQHRYGHKEGEYRSWGDKISGGSDPINDFFRTGVTVQTSGSLSVGNEKNQTYLSFASANAAGIVPENEYGKNNITLRNTTRFLDDKMTLDFGLSYIKQKDKNMIAQGKYGNPLPAVYTFPRGESFADVLPFEEYDQVRAINSQRWSWGDQGLELQNPYWVLHRNPTSNNRDRYMMNVNITYEIADWINVMGRARLDNSVNHYERKYYATTRATFAPETGAFLNRQEESKQSYADLIFNINQSWDDLSLTANIGTSISDKHFIERGVNGKLVIPNFFANTNIDKSYGKTTLIEGGWHEQEQAIFANMELGWRNMLYLTLTGRNDWSSALAKTKQHSFFYPSVGLSAILSEMFNMPQSTYMKVRGSYSSVGSAIPRNLSIETYPYDGQSNMWSTNSYKPVDDLKPERTNSWEIGLSAKFWGNKLSFDATWYQSNTMNQTLKVPISASSGYKEMYIQTGNVMNRGVELAIGTQHQWNSIVWDGSLTAGYNKNEIVELMEEGQFFDPAGNPISLDNVGQGGIGASQFRLTKGGTMGDLWTKKTLKMKDGVPVVGGKGEPLLEDKLEKAGSVLPDWNIGFRNTLKWNNLQLGFMLSARFGGVVMSHTQAVLDGFGVSEASALARDNGGVKVGNHTFDAQQYYLSTGQTEGLTQNYIYSANNIRLQELSLGYTLPTSWFNEQMKAHVAFIGNNLLMLYNKAPFDPEVTASTGTYFQGMDYFMQPSRKSLGFSVRVEF